MKIASIMWSSHLPMLIKAGKNIPFLETTFFSSKELEEDSDKVEEAIKVLEKQDLILLYRSTEGFWGMVENRIMEIGKKVPIVCLGFDPSYWSLSTTNIEIVSTAYTYLMNNGEENLTNMLRYLCRELCDMEIEVEKPKLVPWEGIFHPDAPTHFSTIEEYLSWYGHKEGPYVGILSPRNSWINEDLDLETVLIRQLEEQGLNVIPAFSYSMKKDDIGNKGSAEVVREFFFDETGNSRIDAMIKLQTFFLSSGSSREQASAGTAAEGVALLKKLDVPVFSPLHSVSTIIEEWENEPQGFTGRLVGWAVAMPEFEGVIEPIIIAGGKNERDDISGTLLQRRIPLEERCGKLTKRITSWVRLRRKPVAERKIAFILHNNPCASVEATVGGAAKLDSLESLARIMQDMEKLGYNIPAPESGNELITTIMDRKAISEFRWTTTDEIVKKGGVLEQVTPEHYSEWFETLPQKIQTKIVDAWGNPPGEEKNGVPAAMVYKGNILVTGVKYGNSVVCVQPKRGCAGPQCDGRVCKILHEPDIAPPHQYLATYNYLERDFGADAIVHVGTHGNLEFLPGKGLGLSKSCFPDIGIGAMPHLYIYNSDNPPEGVIAKRRSYATLVDHMQTVMTIGGLYDEMEELDRALAEYEQIKHSEPAREHLLKHQIMELFKATNIDKEIKVILPDSEDPLKKLSLSELDHEQTHHLSFDGVVREAHGILSRVRNTQIQDGMHIFGELPQEERRAAFLNAILRYDADGQLSLRKTIAGMIELDMNNLLSDQAAIDVKSGKNHGLLLEEIDSFSKEFIAAILDNRDSTAVMATSILGERLVNSDMIPALDTLSPRIIDINRRIEASKEIDALMHGFDGGYIPPGPSGLIMRGRDDVLPTGRNFYILDPQRIPTKSAWQVGLRLADAIIDKHGRDEGRCPENVAIHWMANDIMWADGEGMAQIMYLIGVKPLWQPNGRVKGFEIIPFNELGRPRVDVTIRVSGITRDSFPNCIDIIDEAIQAVASLPESPEENFVRKHAMAQIKEGGQDLEDKNAWRDATLRIFASQAGTYSSGTQLAVYASAWKEEKDLADIFVFWNGYAYGKGVYGEEKHKQLAANLKTVDLTYNKVVSDESDLFACCCYFGTLGGMTAAARNLSGKNVKTYYGDTREPTHVEVRDMADEIRRVVRTKLLNPKWIEGQKRHGYKGAGDISKRVGRVYGWEATTQEVDDWVFDDIAKTFVLDKENREFFEENNPWALEEIGRRLLEANERDLWDADPEVLEQLKNSYLEIESWIEEKMGDVEGDFQGGSVDILTSEDVEDWGAKMKEIQDKLHK